MLALLTQQADLPLIVKMAVKAEIDALSGVGFWFDTPEFDLEKE